MENKIADRYEDEVYVVCEQPRLDIPVYGIKSKDKERTLHKNLLYLLESHINENDGEDISNSRNPGKYELEKKEEHRGKYKTEVETCDVTDE